MTNILCTPKFINFQCLTNYSCQPILSPSPNETTGNNIHNHYPELNKQRLTFSHLRKLKLSVASLKCLGMHYLNLILSTIYHPSFYKQLDAILAQKQSASGHENVRQVNYHICKKQGKSKTKCIGNAPFQ